MRTTTKPAAGATETRKLGVFNVVRGVAGPRFGLANLIVVLLVCLPALGAEPKAPNPMIHAEGTRIVDGEGAPIQLRGVILEGWLMWNGTLWGAGLRSETKIADRIERLVGAEETEAFRAAVYENFITERDIEMIAELGFNVVRVPFNHTVLEKDGRIDDAAVGWAYIDRLLDWCEAHGVYAVLDLHAVPGGQSGVFVSDPDPKHVWGSEPDLQRTVDLWKAIAERYRDREIVAGYDLVNEPEPPKGGDLVDLYRRIIEAIRTVDPHHLVFLEGGGPASSDFAFYQEALDGNQAYSFHTYNLFSDAVAEGYFDEMALMAETQDVPLWNGEFGAHTDEWIGRHIELFEDPSHHVNGWIFWPWKRVPEGGWASKRFRHLLEIESTEAWDTVRKYLASMFGTKKIPLDVARQGLADFIDASKAENLVADDRMVSVLARRQVDGEVSAPGKLHEDMTFDHGGLTRTFHFYESGGHAEDDRPLVFLLHGGGGVIDNHIGLGATRWPHQLWLDIARRDAVHLVVPQGIRSQWNDCRSDCEHCGEQDDVGFLLSLLDDLATRYGVDRSRVYAVGESNGGILTLRLAQEHPERFAGMGVVIAQMPENNECTPSEVPISIMFQLGTRDRAVPYGGGRSINRPSGSFLSAEETLAHWVEHNRCEPEPTRSDVPDRDRSDKSRAWREDWACSATGTALAAYHLEDAGHVPPSIEVRTSAIWQGLAGAQNHDVESATAFWAFLEGQRRAESQMDPELLLAPESNQPGDTSGDH